MRRVRIFFALTLMAAASALSAARAQSGGAVAYLAEWDGIIHPVAVAYIRRAIERADAAQATVLILTLRTPGGLVDSTRDINSAILASRTPVVVFVGPSGSRAASAGFLIAVAADLVAMAPGTHIGAIEIGERFSVVELQEDVVERVLDAMRKTRINGRKVPVRRFIEK